MKFLIQRITHVKVEAQGATVGIIKPNAHVVIGVTHEIG